MRVAVYSRKSRLSETGDSIANQITMCKDYANAHFKDCEFFLYEDEGFSGGNTERPMFKQLIKDIGKKKFDVLVCYRLDRISRNVANFSETLEILNKHNVGFVSIKEQFDTTSPMGKAMMYISSVFAQLERDTIAERITDNLSQLAKSGHYVGSKSPQGYKRLQKIAPNGKHYDVLVQDENEIDKIKLFFEKYLEMQSINKLETYCLLNGIKTRKGYNYKCVTIRRVLTHPAYAAADKHTYEYFKGLGAQVYDSIEKWNGKVGVVVYRRTNHSDPKEWIVGAGEHEPAVSSVNWLQIQDIIEKRRGLTIRRPIGKWGVLSGILRCKDCGDYMRPFCRRADGDTFYYICSTKETSRKQMCSINNIRGDIFDKDIVSKVRELLQNDSEVLSKMRDKQETADQNISQGKDETVRLKTEVGRNEAAIKNLVMKLSESTDGTVEKYISAQIKELDERNTFLRQEMVRLENEKDALETESLNNEIASESLNKVNNQNFDEYEFAVRRNILKTLIEKVIWDGESAEIMFH